MATRNPPWSDEEIDLIIVDYFDMLQMELLGKEFVKKDRRETLQKHLDNRSRGSVEYKHQNISAVLQELGRPWLPGYVPMKKYQKALADGVERYLDHTKTLADQDNRILVLATQSNQTGQCLPLEPAPTLKTSETKILKRLIRKYDPATRDARNRALGKLGEERVLISERIRLAKAGRKDLAKEIKWISQEEGDGAGYDILSFSTSGEERLLEVKTTPGHRHTPFYLTENERLTSIEHSNEYRLVRLYNFGSSPKIFKLSPPLDEAVTLRPTNYRASFHT